MEDMNELILEIESKEMMGFTINKSKTKLIHDRADNSNTIRGIEIVYFIVRD